MNRITPYLLSFVFGIVPWASYAEDFSVLSADDIQWGLLNPLRGDASPRAADLWGDRTQNTATGMLVKFKKGFSSPPHIHNITYRGVVIKVCFITTIHQQKKCG